MPVHLIDGIMPPVPFPHAPRPQFLGLNQFPGHPLLPPVATGLVRRCTVQTYLNHVNNDNWFCDPSMVDIWDYEERYLLAFRMVQTMFELWRAIEKGRSLDNQKSRMRRIMGQYHVHQAIRDLIGQEIGTEIFPGYGRETVRFCRDMWFSRYSIQVIQFLVVGRDYRSSSKRALHERSAGSSRCFNWCVDQCGAREPRYRREWASESHLYRSSTTSSSLEAPLGRF